MKFNLIYFLDSADKPFSIFVQIYLVNTSPKKEVNMLPPQPLYAPERLGVDKAKEKNQELDEKEREKATALGACRAWSPIRPLHYLRGL